MCFYSYTKYNILLFSWYMMLTVRIRSAIITTQIKSSHIAYIKVFPAFYFHLLQWLVHTTLSVNTSAWTSYSKLKNLTSFNPQKSNSAKLELEKTWKTRITRPKPRKTRAKFELHMCSNSTVWNSMKLELDKKWARSGTSRYTTSARHQHQVRRENEVLFLCLVWLGV